MFKKMKLSNKIFVFSHLLNHNKGKGVFVFDLQKKLGAPTAHRVDGIYINPLFFTTYRFPRQADP